MRLLVDQPSSSSGFDGGLLSWIAQVRNYGRFFADPRNHDSLKEQFTGIVPQPKLGIGNRSGPHKRRYSFPIARVQHRLFVNEAVRYRI
jgi:hypothetical protein